METNLKRDGKAFIERLIEDEDRLKKMNPNDGLIGKETYLNMQAYINHRHSLLLKEGLSELFLKMRYPNIK